MRVHNGQNNEVEALQWELEEANYTIAQLEEQLASVEYQLQRERAAREHAEHAAEQAARAAEVAAQAAIEAAHQASTVRMEGVEFIAQRDQDRITMEIMIQQEQAARKEAELAAEQATQAAELAARAAIEASRQQPAVELVPRAASEDFDMEDVTSSFAAPFIAPVLATQKAPVASKTRRMPTTLPPAELQQSNKENSKSFKRKMSLAEARKAAQYETEKRVQERASMLLSKK